MAKGCGHYLCGLANAECGCPPPLESNRAGDILQKALEKRFPARGHIQIDADIYVSMQRQRYLFLIGIVNGLADESENFDLAIRKIAKNLEQG